jgi:hypothetical protein
METTGSLQSGRKMHPSKPPDQAASAVLPSRYQRTSSGGLLCEAKPKAAKSGLTSLRLSPSFKSHPLFCTPGEPGMIKLNSHWSSQWLFTDPRPSSSHCPGLSCERAEGAEGGQAAPHERLRAHHALAGPQPLHLLRETTGAV